MKYLILALLSFSIISSGLGSDLRYVKYIFPILLLLLSLLVSAKINVPRFLLTNFKLYFILIFSNLLFILFGFIDREYVSIRFLLETIFILSPIFFMIGIQSFKLNIEKFINHFAIINIVLFILLNLKGFIDLFSIDSIINAFILSSLPTESGMAFPLGFFTIYFFTRNKKIMFFLCLFFFLLAFKRIAIIALIISIIASKLKFTKSKFFYKYLPLFATILNFFVLKIIISFASGDFDDIITDLTGVNSNALSLGRFTLFSEVLDNFKNANIFGSGLGSTSEFVSTHLTENLLHSDILKISIEFGSIFFILWIFYFYKANLVDINVFPIILFMNILFFTDNIFIYFDCLLIFYLVISTFEVSNFRLRITTDNSN